MNEMTDEMSAVRLFRVEVGEPPAQTVHRARGLLDRLIADATDGSPVSAEMPTAEAATRLATVLPSPAPAESPASPALEALPPPGTDRESRGVRPGLGPRRRRPHARTMVGIAAAAVAVAVAVPVGVVTTHHGDRPSSLVAAATGTPTPGNCWTAPVPAPAKLPPSAAANLKGPFWYTETFSATWWDAAHPGTNSPVREDWVGRSAWAYFVNRYFVDEKAPMFQVGDKWRPTVDLVNLPTDASVLRPMLTEGFDKPVEDRTVFIAATDLLRFPVSPGTQSALFTVVSSLESATTNEHDRDLIGRPAVSVSVPDSRNPGTFDRVYFTPEQHHYLGQDAGGKTSDPCTFAGREVVLASGWVDSIGQVAARQDPS